MVNKLTIQVCCGQISRSDRGVSNRDQSLRHSLIIKAVNKIMINNGFFPAYIGVIKNIVEKIIHKHLWFVDSTGTD
jgi:hypothetical protein